MEYSFDFFAQYGLFLAKSITVLVCIVVVLVLILVFSQKGHKSHRGHIEVTKLNDLLDDMKDSLRSGVLDAHGLKLFEKSEKQKEKAEKSEKKKAAKKAKNADPEPQRKRVFVLDFDGDVKASATDQMREEITTVLTLAQPEDEVVVRLESGGGMVHSYGLAASQLQRITGKQIPLTVCVDKVAASGGYMMACVANKIVAAPFAIIGSIGVVGQLPNFHRLLKKNDIDYEMQTAGEYKRTLTMFAENTDKARQKFAEELEETHHLFKDYIRDNRPTLDVDKVATGETWYGKRALDNQLIDLIQTSDEYLYDMCASADIVEVHYVQKKSLSEKVGFSVQASLDRLLLTWWDRIHQSKFFS